jgi:hypothetical protein
VETGISKEKLLLYKEIAIKHLSNPLKLRLTTVFTFVAVGIVFVYMPLSKRIQAAEKMLADERERNEKICDVEKLRKQVRSYRDRIGDNSDTNEWVQYTLDGLRNFKVKLREMESGEQKRVGPYHAVTLSMEIEGLYPRLEGYIEWLEKSERILRIDSVRFEKRPQNLLMKIIILGLVPKNARNAG